MPESNFTDYVKILCRSGKGGAGSRHYHRAKYVPKGAARRRATEAAEDTYSSEATHTCGHSSPTLPPTHIRRKRTIRIRRTKLRQRRRRHHHRRTLRNSRIRRRNRTIPLRSHTRPTDSATTQKADEADSATGTSKAPPTAHHATHGPANQPPNEPSYSNSNYSPTSDSSGFPNAGKSTLLSAISAARPKIADYPFTTMEPQLGIVSYRDNRSFVMADIPGIIEGASQGKGLGLRFLRHIERNAVLLFMVPADADDITAQYHILLEELHRFNPQLIDKQRILAISKSDMLDDELRQAIQTTLPTTFPTYSYQPSPDKASTHSKDLLWASITDERNQIATPAITHRPLDALSPRHRRTSSSYSPTHKPPTPTTTPKKTSAKTTATKANGTPTGTTTTQHHDSTTTDTPPHHNNDTTTPHHTQRLL